MSEPLSLLPFQISNSDTLAADILAKLQSYGVTLDTWGNGANYGKVALALATALNAGTKVVPSATGAADADAIATAVGATLAARLVGLAGPTIAGGSPAVPQVTIQTASKAQNEYITMTAAANKMYLAVCWNGSQSTSAAISLIVCDTAAYATTIVACAGVSDITTNALDVRFANKHANTSSIRALLFQIGW